jgi:hypothetical protein
LTVILVITKFLSIPMTKIKPLLHALIELMPTGECPLGYVMLQPLFNVA